MGKVAIVVEGMPSCTKERDIVGVEAFMDIAFEEGVVRLEEVASVIGEQEIVARFPKSEWPDGHGLETMRRRLRRISIVSVRIFSR